MKDETIQKPTEEEKEIENSLFKAKIIQIDTLGKLNKSFFKELQKLSEQIENKTAEMFRLSFSEEEVKKMIEGEELSFQFEIKDVKSKENFVNYWEKTFNKLNNNFLADNFFLLFNNMTEQFKELTEEEKKKNDDVLYYADILMNQKEDLFHDFEKIQEEIEKNNKKIGEIEKELFQSFKISKVEEIEAKEKNEPEDNEVAIISEKHSEDIVNIVEHTSKAHINDMTLFEMYNKTMLQIKFSAETKKTDEAIILIIKIKREENYSSKTYILKQTKKDFKDIKVKTQAISMYKPTQMIFLKGEEISKIYKEQAIVPIPFGLKAENENEITYKITSLNYEQSDKDLRFFNACISAQWNLIKNKYPVNTFIEETTLYQIYIGDTSFTYRPKQKELEEMKKSIMGMNSNQAKMEFQSSYKYLTEEQKRTYIDEGTILPVRYKTIIVERKNGQKYSKSGYIFDSIIPLFSFMNELKLINTAPLQIESALKSSQMNDEITRILKGEIAQLYYFKSRNKDKDTQNGFKRKVFVTEEGKELTSKEWNERNIECKKENKKNFIKGYWKYYARRTIDSLITDCKFTKKSGEILNAYNEKTIDRKTYSRFIDSVITFLRYSKDISYAQGKYIKDFILYDKQGNIINEKKYLTEAEKSKMKELAKRRHKEISFPKNPSIDKIDIIIT